MVFVFDKVSCSPDWFWIVQVAETETGLAVLVFLPVMTKCWDRMHGPTMLGFYGYLKLWHWIVTLQSSFDTQSSWQESVYKGNVWRKMIRIMEGHPAGAGSWNGSLILADLESRWPQRFWKRPDSFPEWRMFGKLCKAVASRSPETPLRCSYDHVYSFGSDGGRTVRMWLSSYISGHFVSNYPT